jgi:hypothetical protein
MGRAPRRAACLRSNGRWRDARPVHGGRHILRDGVGVASYSEPPRAREISAGLMLAAAAPVKRGMRTGLTIRCARAHSTSAPSDRGVTRRPLTLSLSPCHRAAATMGWRELVRNASWGGGSYDGSCSPSNIVGPCLLDQERPPGHHPHVPCRTSAASAAMAVQSPARGRRAVRHSHAPRRTGCLDHSPRSSRKAGASTYNEAHGERIRPTARRSLQACA